MAEKKIPTKQSVPKKAAPKKKDETVKVTTPDKSVSIDKPERTAKLMFENDLCIIVEDYDAFDECVYYVLSNKILPEKSKFTTMDQALDAAKMQGLK